MPKYIPNKVQVMPVNTANLDQCLDELYTWAKNKKEEITEEDLRVSFIELGILKLLGYEKIGEDIRLERTVSKKRADIQCLDDYGNVIFIIEFKKPADEKNLKEYYTQLWDRYVIPLRAKYGILTNGLEIIAYERVGLNSEKILKKSIADLTGKDCESIEYRLRKPPHKKDNLKIVTDYFSRFRDTNERRPLTTDLSRELFFEDFMLKEGSLFAELVKSTIILFDYQYGKSKFLTSAYDFWLKSYAKKPDSIPKTWERLLETFDLEPTDENLNKFMFCLETAYALFTRLILAKACEDYEFPHIDFFEFMKGKVSEQRGEIPLVAWGILLTKWIENMRNNLVESIFEEDIFYWWTDKYNDMDNWQLWELFSPNKVDNELQPFCECSAGILFTLYKYDFSKIAGDPLGDLYQKYFDKETRKALGEFYTPKEVVKYILDAVGYNDNFIMDKRLLDPACGSGTFLIDALNRYLKQSRPTADEKGWNVVLKKLCNEFHIVGFDIHPFATIMAQIHFMLILIPYYKMAIDAERDFVLRRLPIFRTDSLIDERKNVKTQSEILSYEEGVRTVTLNISLPIKKEIGDKEFIMIKVKMPRSIEVWEKTDLTDIPQYFCALQAIFDTVKYQARNEKYEIDKNLLKRRFKEYLADKNWDGLAKFFSPYGNEILCSIKDLKYKFGDGRLVKSIEDVMLAGLLKNYVKYDYVVGNPPYVRFHGLSEKDKRNYHTNYVSAYKQYDIYVLFIERGVKWLNDNGKFGYIVSSKFSTSEYGKKVRAFLLENVSIKEIIDVSNFSVFKDASIYPYIIIMDRENDDNKRKLNKMLIALNIENEAKFVNGNYKTEKLPQSRFYNNTNLIFDLQTKKTMGIVNKIEKDTTMLQELTKITRGFRPPPEHLVISRELYNQLSKEDKNRYRKYIIGKDMVSPYLIKWSGNYLEYLRDQIHESKPIKLFEQPKIMVRDIGLHLSACYDDEGLLCLKTIYFIYTPGEEINLKLLMGILNSKVVEFYFYSKFWAAHIGGGYMRFRKQYLDLIPIKLPNTKNELKIANRIISKVNHILTLVKIKLNVENFPDSYLKRHKGMELLENQYTFKANHKSLEPTLMESINGKGYPILLAKKEESISLETQTKAEYLIIALNGRNVRKGNKIKILIPKNENKLERILREYKEDIKQLERQPILKLQNEINELVYKLYGLNENDIKIMKAFLTKF